MQLVDDSLWRHADSGDEELGTRFDDDVDKLRELALCVVVADGRVSQSFVVAVACRLTWSCGRRHRPEEEASRLRMGRSCR